MSVEDRIAPALRLAAIFQERSDEMAELITHENGSPITFSKLGQIGGPLMMLLGLPAQAAALEWEETRAGSYGNEFVVRKEPVGVVGAITAWNVPQILIVAKIVPALLVGCTVVLKPAPDTPLDALLLAADDRRVRLPARRRSASFRATRRAGERSSVTRTSTRSPSPARPQSGDGSARAAARTCGACTLELGGKSAAIVLDDAKHRRRPCAVCASRAFSTTVRHAPRRPACWCPGRTTATSLTRSRRRIAEMPVGDPMVPETEIGPLVARASGSACRATSTPGSNRVPA